MRQAHSTLTSPARAPEASIAAVGLAGTVTSPASPIASTTSSAICKALLFSCPAVFISVAPLMCDLVTASTRKPRARFVHYSVRVRFLQVAYVFRSLTRWKRLKKKGLWHLFGIRFAFWRLRTCLPPYAVCFANCNMHFTRRRNLQIAMTRPAGTFAGMMRVARLLPPEAAHRLALHALSLFGPGGPPHDTPRLQTTLWGRTLSNPLGLAAGLDKDGVALAGFARLGFRAIEIGSVTPRPQPGNPRPRLFRLAEDRAVINRDRKSTRLNSSHGYISYAVFCLK